MNALRQIHMETYCCQDGEKGDLVNRSVNRLVRFLEEVGQDGLGDSKGKEEEVRDVREVIKQVAVRKVHKNVEEERQINNENINTMNTTIPQRSITIQKPQRKLIQLSRPQYKIQLPYQTTQQHFSIPSYQIKTTNTTKTTPKKQRPKSPTLQSIPKQQNISQIGKSHQTQTDISFEIDLKGMGIIPQKILTQKYRSQSSKIAEEDSWICDEQQLQEQLKKIDERLSARCWVKQQQQQKDQHPRLFDVNKEKGNQPVVIGQKREVKKVRLSLTPKKKINRKVQNDKSPKPQKERSISPFRPVKNQLPTKWTKSKRGLLTLEIQKAYKKN